MVFLLFPLAVGTCEDVVIGVLVMLFGEGLLCPDRLGVDACLNCCSEKEKFKKKRETNQEIDKNSKNVKNLKNRENTRKLRENIVKNAKIK